MAAESGALAGRPAASLPPSPLSVLFTATVEYVCRLYARAPFLRPLWDDCVAPSGFPHSNSNNNYPSSFAQSPQHGRGHSVAPATTANIPLGAASASSDDLALSAGPSSAPGAGAVSLLPSAASAAASAAAASGAPMSLPAVTSPLSALLAPVTPHKASTSQAQAQAQLKSQLQSQSQNQAEDSRTSTTLNAKLGSTENQSDFESDDGVSDSDDCSGSAAHGGSLSSDDDEDAFAFSASVSKPYTNSASGGGSAKAVSPSPSSSQVHVPTDAATVALSSAAAGSAAFFAPLRPLVRYLTGAGAPPRFPVDLPPSAAPSYPPSPAHGHGHGASTAQSRTNSDAAHAADVAAGVVDRAAVGGAATAVPPGSLFAGPTGRRVLPTELFAPLPVPYPSLRYLKQVRRTAFEDVTLAVSHITQTILSDCVLELVPTRAAAQYLGATSTAAAAAAASNNNGGAGDNAAAAASDAHSGADDSGHLYQQQQLQLVLTPLSLPTDAHIEHVIRRTVSRTLFHFTGTVISRLYRIQNAHKDAALARRVARFRPVVISR